MATYGTKLVWCLQILRVSNINLLKLLPHKENVIAKLTRVCSLEANYAMEAVNLA